MILVTPFLVAQRAPAADQPPPENPLATIRPTYVLGPGDQIVIRAIDVEDISDKPFRIDSEGEMNLPVLGKIHAGGLTIEQLERDLTERLKTIVRNPQVTVSVAQFRSEPVFLDGYFKTPGFIPLQGRRTLLDVLTAAGGLLPNSSRKITVTRRLEMGPIPLPSAVVDQQKKVSTVEISIDSLRTNVNPAEDIVLQPFDTISATRAELIYVNGEVSKAGSVELGERASLTITQLVAMVGGLSKDAAPQKATVLRPILNTSKRSAIPVDLKKIFSGKESDFPLFPNDVLYVPRGGHSAALTRVGLIALPMATGLIYVLSQKL